MAKINSKKMKIGGTRTDCSQRRKGISLNVKLLSGQVSLRHVLMMASESEEETRHTRTDLHILITDIHQLIPNEKQLMSSSGSTICLLDHDS